MGLLDGWSPRRRSGKGYPLTRREQEALDRNARFWQLKAESQNRAHREPKGERPGGGRGKGE